MQYSFNGGEISPEMYGRIDTSKYQTGLATCLNFIVQTHGPIQYRNGFEYVATGFNNNQNARIIPFIFSDEQAVVLYLNYPYMYVLANGAMVLDGSNNPIKVSIPWQADDLPQLRYAQSADVVTITHPKYKPATIKRLSATVWEYAEIATGYGIDAPIGINAVATAPQVGNNVLHRYAVTAVKETSESQASGEASVMNDLTLAGNLNTITWSAVTGATRYRIYKQRSGVYSFIGETTALTLIDDYIEANGALTPPLIRNPFASYPTAVSYFGQRKVYGGGFLTPQTLNFSRTATDNNFTYSIPVRDDDAIQVRFAARDGNAVKHLVPMGELLVLTGGAVWRVSSDGPMSSTSINVKPQSFTGANDVTPIQAGGACVFASNQTGRIHELSLSADRSNAYQTLELSVMCPHLFDGYEITDMAMVRNPWPIVFFVRSDGALIGMTYDAQQQVYAFHQHSTQGEFESIAAIPEDGQTVLYAAIWRNGVKYVERLRLRKPASLRLENHLDCSITYEGAATSQLSGLDYLEGREISILADGALHPKRTVVGGIINLQDEATTITIGLDYQGLVKSLPLSGDKISAVKPKIATHVYLRVLGSSSIFAGQGLDAMQEYKQRSNEPYGTPPRLQSGIIEIPVQGHYDADIAIYIQQNNPLPLTVQAMDIKIARTAT